MKRKIREVKILNKIKYMWLRPLLSTLLIASLLLCTSAPALAEQATVTDKLVQCDSTGVVTDHKAITGVNLPVVFDNSSEYYPISVDVSIYIGATQVKELTGLAPDKNGDLKIGLGASSNYTEGTVYGIQYRAHYGTVGEESEIIEEWQNSGLYFEVEATSDITNAVLTAATADSAADISTSTKIDLTFDTAITGLTASDIAITSVTGSATKGALTGSGKNWSIAISSVSKGTVSVAVGSPTGYSVSGSPKTVNVYAAPTPTTADSMISPMTASFDKYSGNANYKAVSVTLTLHGNTLNGIYNGLTQLTGSNYSISNSTVTIPISYLTTLSTGSANLTFKFSAGNDQTLSITASDSTPATVGTSGGGTTTDTTNTATTSTADGTTTATTNVNVTTSADKTSTASVTAAQITSAVTDAVKEATSQSTEAVVKISIASRSSSTSVSTTIPQAAFDTIADSSVSKLTISSSVATVTFDSTALDAINGSATANINFTVDKVNTSELSAAVQSTIGSRPVYNLTVSSGSSTISSFGGGKATVSIPYTLATGEDANKIVIYYISGSGEFVTVPNCVYDASTGTAIFTTTHFSNYAVGYNDVSFTDVSGWYKDYVSYLAARKIISGTDSETFSPDDSITRAQFVTILARMSCDDLSGYAASSFSDVTTTDWYFAAVQWAYKNGVASGSDGKFAPGANITREQMAVMLYNYAKYAGSDVSNVEGTSVREFSDYDSISSWALEPIQWSINNSIISGSGDGNFAPIANTTRAQAAKMIALLLQRLIRS